MSTTAPTAQTLLSIAETDVTTPIPTPTLLPILTSPPFLHIPGTFNSRDLGLLPYPAGTPRIKPNLIIRTASLQGLTDEGAAAIRKLGVKTIYDLRSIKEHETAPDPVVEGVSGVWVKGDERDAMEDVRGFVEGGGEKGYEGMYLGVLGDYRDAFKRVLEGVRDGGGVEALVVHCNAGRDRTGVISGMLLGLAGVDPDIIALDFMLSRIGTEPAREQLLAFAMRGTGVTSVDEPGFYNLCSLRVSSWERFVKGVEREFGGWEGYVTGTLGFSQEELDKIKKNLVAEP